MTAVVPAGAASQPSPRIFRSLRAMGESAKKFMVEKDANRVSVLMSLSDNEGSLYRMLTKFRVAGLNLLKIESRPRHEGNFDVVFYLDFEGSMDDERVNALLCALKNEVTDFRFLGNYNEII